MEAKTKNTKLNDDDLFTIVGADYQIHTPVLKKPNLWYRLKGKPIASIIILVLIIGGCIFAELKMCIRDRNKGVGLLMQRSTHRAGFLFSGVIISRFFSFIILF